MKLNFNPITQNQIFNSYRINQSAAAKMGRPGLLRHRKNERTWYSYHPRESRAVSWNHL